MPWRGHYRSKRREGSLLRATVLTQFVADAFVPTHQKELPTAPVPSTRAAVQSLHFLFGTLGLHLHVLLLGLFPSFFSLFLLLLLFLQLLFTATALLTLFIILGETRRCNKTQEPKQQEQNLAFCSYLCWTDHELSKVIEMERIVRSLGSRASLIKGSLLLLFAFSTLQCAEEQKGEIPNVPLDIYININEPRYANLQAIGGWEYLTGGSKGLIVYRRSNDTFLAYDRHCTYRPSENCGRAAVDSSNIKIHCRACSGSEYSIQDGSVLKGPATQPLKRYGTSFDGDILHIYN